MTQPAKIRLRRLLVGVDERAHAEHAVQAGVHLARASGAKLGVVHALPLPQPLGGVDAIADWVETSARIQDAAREHVLARIRPAFAAEAPQGLDGQGADELLDVIPGQPARVLAEEVRERAADLIVIGAHARRAGIDFGNTARALLAASDVPVWVQPGPWQRIARLLVPIDMTSGAERVLAVARGMGALLGVRVEVLHTYDPPSFAYDPDLPAELMPRYVIDDLRAEDRAQFETLAGGFPWEGVPTSSTWVEGRPAETILELARADDLIVMGTHGRGGFLGRVLGSEAWTVLGKSSTPVLVVPLHPAADAASA